MKNCKKIVLVTTENCASCERMKSLVNDFKDVFAKNEIESITVDKGSVTEVISEVVKLEDYPTFIFIKDDKVIGTHKGTINPFKFLIELKRIFF